MRIKIKKSYLVASIITIIFGIFVIWYIGDSNTKDFCKQDYTWLNSKIKCERPVISKAEYVTLKKELAAKIEEMTKSGDVDVVAVFYRDLVNGPKFNINEQHSFIPASLLKVPIMLTFFKLAEDKPELLEKTLIYSSKSADLLVSQTVPDELMLAQDQPYTIDDLIFRMVAYSDNHSTRMLEAYAYALSPEVDLIQQTYFELGLLDPDDNTPGDYLSVKAYSSLFRLLYNGSYLSYELSDKALDYLSRADFKEGIVSGVPRNISVAHKFGERLEKDFTQLHDCGIIYYPDNPYLLCVMTRGKNYDVLKNVLHEISESVWEEIDSRKL